ncbi:MAG: esterase-like activity of phytase family protein [bacterium]|nr:esterase-like activity of phytase family protein [bacterium]
MRTRTRARGSLFLEGFLVALMFLATAATSGAEPATVELELLSVHDIPGGTRFGDTCLGGLSALFYDHAKDRYFAVSDSRTNARIYTLRIEIEEHPEDGPRIAGVDFETVVRLSTREGVPYPDGRVDPEGFALVDAGTAFLSSEGVARDGVPPFVDLVEVDTGSWLSTLPLPASYRPRHDGDDQVSGVRNNLGLESLTLSPGHRYLFTASESALAQDAGGLATGVEHFARVLRVDLGSEARRFEEALYPLVMPEGDVVVHGLVELLALDDDGHLLAMERTYAHDRGLTVRLYEVHFSQHRADPDRSRLSPEAESLPVLDKRPLLDFGKLPVLLDNLEGLTLGPRLADGSESLLVVGDNDNTECQPPTSLAQMRPTKLLLFRLKR